MARVDRTTWWKTFDARLEELLARRLPRFQRLLLAGEEALGHSPDVLETIIDDGGTREALLLGLWRDLEAVGEGQATLPRLLDDVLATVAVRADKAVTLHYRRGEADASMFIERRLEPVLVALLERLLSWIDEGGKVEIRASAVIDSQPELHLLLDGGPAPDAEESWDEVAATLLDCFGGRLPQEWDAGVAESVLTLP